jgi:hypothetical protein
MNKTEIRYGCDNCGFAVPATKAKKLFPMLRQWHQVWLCDNCMKLIKTENANMRQGRTRQEYLNSI